MARTEARIFNDIWEDDDFVTAPAGEQRLYLFLTSQKDLSHAGVIPLRASRWARKCSDLSTQDVEQYLEGLAARRFVIVDHETGEVLVRSLIRRDKIYRQPNVMKAAIDYVPLIESLAILRELLGEMARIRAGDTELSTEMGKALDAMENALSQRVPHQTAPPAQNPSAKGSENPSTNPSEKGSAKSPRGTGSVTAVPTDSPFPDSPRSPLPAAARASAREEPPPPDTEPGQAEQLLTEWKARKRRPVGHVVAKVGLWIAGCLAEGHDPEHIAEALRRWDAKQETGPGLLPHILDDVVNRPNGASPTTRASPRQSTTDQRVNAALALAAEFRAEAQKAIDP